MKHHIRVIPFLLALVVLCPRPAAGAYLLSFSEADERSGGEDGYHMLQVLVGDTVVYERDINESGDLDETVDITSAVGSPDDIVVAFRLLEAHGVSNAKIRATVTKIHLENDGARMRLADWSFQAAGEGIDGWARSGVLQLEVGWATGTSTGSYGELRSAPAESVPDWSIDPAGIVMTPTDPLPGELVTATVTIHNIGDGDASPVPVRLSVNSLEIQTLFTGAVLRLGSATLDFSWPFAGPAIERVEVKADPDDQQAEADESNNRAARLLGDGRPRLFFTAADLPALANRPGVSSITDTADGYLSTDAASLDDGGRAEMGRFLALAYALTQDPAYAEKAREALATIGEPNPAWNCLDYSYILFPYAQAFDWVALYEGFGPGELDQARLRLLAMGEACYTMLAYDDPEACYANMRIRAAASLGLLALALGPASDPAQGPDEWLRYVLYDFFEVPIFFKSNAYNDLGTRGPLLASLISSDGAYAEGPSYMNYTFKLAIQFFGALDAAVGTRTVLDPLIEGLFDWMLAIQMPNGMMPTFDTGWEGRAKGQYKVVGAHSDGGVHRFYWEMLGRPCGSRIDCFLYVDEDNWPAAISPDDAGIPPTQFFPEGGQAVFRSGWGPDDTYLLLLAEHSPNISSHEQADQSSFLLYARGAYLAIDPGDGRNYRGTNRADEEGWMQSALGHNLVVVDRLPSPGLVHTFEYVQDPAYLRDHFTTPFLDYAAVDLTYGHLEGIPDELVTETPTPGVVTTRHVVFPSKDYFIILDDLRAETTHDYDFQLHLGEVSTGTVAVKPGQATWSTTNDVGEPVALHMWFAHPEVSLSTTTGGTDYEPETRTFDHMVLRARARGQDVRFLTVLMPRRESEPPAEVLRLVSASATGAVVTPTEGAQDFVVIPQERSGEGSLAAIDTNSSLTVVGTRSGQTTFVYVRDATWLTVGGTALLQASTAALVALRTTETGIDGEVHGPGDYTLAVYTGDLQPAEATHRGVPVLASYEETTGMTTFELSGAGPLVCQLTDGLGSPAGPAWPTPTIADGELVAWPKSNSGCGCGTSGRLPGSPLLALAGVVALLLWVRRRRRQRMVIS